ncbi:MAG: hypothetical protein ACXAAH_00310 [Promethearchaeota archaeon]|jgi:hypothetical protein
MKKILLFLILIIVLFSCVNHSSSDSELAEKTEEIMSEINTQVGMPNISNFYEKKLLKMLYELRDDSELICYAYFFNEREGKIGDFIGKCIGFGLPYAVQYSNPEKKTGRKWPDKLPQAEPNGLFMPDSLSATWLMLINPETNEPQPVYIEPLIIVSPFPLR